MRVLFLALSIALIAGCTKNKTYNYCDENPCSFNAVHINETIVEFNFEVFSYLNNAVYLGFERVIHDNYPVKAEIISFSGLPDTTGIFYLKKGDLFSGYPAVSYCYFEEDVCIDNSAPYDSTSSWIDIYSIDSNHVQGSAHLELYRSDNVLPSTFYGDVDTLSITFEFDVRK